MKDYLPEYAAKRVSAPEAAALLRPGQQVFLDDALSQPKALLDAMGELARTERLRDVTLYTTLDIYDIPCYAPDVAGKLNGVSWFCGASARRGVNSGCGDVMPGYYRDFSRIVREHKTVDVFCAAVAPMDKHGYFSLSTVASYTNVLIEQAKYIILEVNRNLPRTHGAPIVHISQVTALCENDMPLLTLPESEPDEISRTIGQYIADEIPDGATIQLGIGAIPNAVGAALREKRNLGLHTEMFTDSMVGLIECGAVDNSRKPIHRGRTVATFAFGSQRIYDYIDDNPAVQILPADYVNDPAIIAQHPNFRSVNAALEVDFYGQTCSESIGTYQVSGTGGQGDFVRGAVLSPGGKSFIALSSTAKGGTVSRIVPTLTPGAIVTTGKNDVDHIVTEYGIARLRGNTLSRRVKELISVAHPNFRDELTWRAKKQNILI